MQEKDLLNRLKEQLEYEKEFIEKIKSNGGIFETTIFDNELEFKEIMRKEVINFVKDNSEALNIKNDFEASKWVHRLEVRMLYNWLKYVKNGESSIKGIKKENE